MQKKELLIVFIVMLFLVIAIIIFSIFFWQKQKNVFLSAQNDKNISVSSSPTQKINIDTQEIKDAPNIFSGTIKNINSNSLEVEFPGDIKYRYKINREEVTNISKMEKNPNFNKEKFDSTLDQIAASIKDSKSQLPMEEIDKKAASDPELQFFKKAASSWDNLKISDSIVVIKDESGKLSILINAPETNSDNN